MKYLVILMLLVIGLNARILFLGGENNQFLCDGRKGTAISLKDCKDVVALTNLNMCYLINSNLDCKKLFKGEKFNSDNLDNDELVFSRLLSFKTVTKTSFGVKRFSDIKELKGVIVPYGDMLKPKKNIDIDFRKNIQKTIIIKSENKILFKKTTSAPVVNINKNNFYYENSYSLIIKINDKEYISNFSIVSKSMEKQVSKAIKSNIKNIDDDKSKKYIKSIILDQYGLLFDRQKTLKEI